MGKRYKAKDRQRLVEAVRMSGESEKVVGARMGVKASTAHYWVKQSREPKAAEFAMVVPASTGANASMSVEVAGVMIHLEAGFGAELLRCSSSTLRPRELVATRAAACPSTRAPGRAI